MIEDLKPKDFVAILTIIAIFGLVIWKSNHGFDALLAMILGYYFAHRTTNADKGN